jgi:uncharacterized lipoprotein YehR (DUF1307 family)
VLALSSSPYEDYDVKSKKFVEDTLDHIEAHFKGYKTFEKELKTSKSHATQNVTLNYFESIKSENKTFNKRLVRKETPSLDAD